MSTVAHENSHPCPLSDSTSSAVRLLEWGVVVVTLVLVAVILRAPYDEAGRVWIVTLAALALVAWITVQDLKTFTVADGAVVSIVCLALADRWALGDKMLTIGLDCLLTGGVLLAFRELYYRRRGVDGLGLGDVKLATAAGLLVGAVAFAWALLAASLLALGFVAARRLVIDAGRPDGLFHDGFDRLAFGAVLAPAIWVAWVVQQLPVLVPLSGP